VNTEQIDHRLHRLQGELATHARIATHLGLDFERPIRALGDGYPENTVALVGKITERLLKQLWNHHNVLGDPSGKALNDLIKGTRAYIADTNVLNALSDIQRMRNRSAHDGYEIAEEDGLLALRRLLEVLSWFTSTVPGVVTGEAPTLTPVVEAKAAFLTGLYSALGYLVEKRFELSDSTVYQLFVHQAGLRVSYVELIISRSVAELNHVMAETGGELLQTRLPKLSRFIVVDDHDSEPAPSPDVRIVPYDRFVDTIVDVPAHLAAVAGTEPTAAGEADRRVITAELLAADDRTGEMTVTTTDDAERLLASLATGPANVLVVGRPGSGKTTLLKRLAAGATGDEISAARPYRFYLDLSLREPGEEFSDFVTRILGPFMSVERVRVFDVFLYLIRAGSVLCLLDAVDEAVAVTSLDGFTDLFAELAQVLSASSAVVMSSRYSFLGDSPPVRRLLHHASLMSERIVENLHAGGINPLELPRFHAVRLHEIALPSGQAPAGAASASPLELRLRAETGLDLPAGDDGDARLTALVEAHVGAVVANAGLTGQLAALTRLFGRGYLAGVTIYPLLDLHAALGPAAFQDGQISGDTFRLAPLFRPAGPHALIARHSVFQEYFAARYLQDPAGRADAAAIEPEPILTEQIRGFLHHLPTEDGPGRRPSASRAGLVPAGTYLVGPSHRLLLRTLDAPVVLDEFAVTVARYRAFLDAVARHGSAAWDHPDRPAGHSHEPWHDRLRRPDYYSNPAYDDYPAVCVDWWSAYAFARYDGGRLPTAVEWEIAARGEDGRLFPWGDAVDPGRGQLRRRLGRAAPHHLRDLEDRARGGPAGREQRHRRHRPSRQRLAVRGAGHGRQRVGMDRDRA